MHFSVQKCTIYLIIEHFCTLCENYLLYFHRFCRHTRTVPYFDKKFETKFSKNIRQKFKVNLFSDRVKLALSESYFSFIFCRLVLENFDIENWFRYGMDTVRRQIRWKNITLTCTIFYFLFFININSHYD